MTGFEPAAAAAAYIGRIPDAARAAAAANTAWAEASILLRLAIFLIVCVGLVRSGLLVKLRSAVRSSRLGPLTADGACGLALGAAALLALLPVWTADVLHARPALGPAGALLAAIEREGGWLELALIAPVLILRTLRRYPRTWGVLVGGAFGALVFCLFWFTYAQASGPAALPTAPPGPAREGLLSLVRDTRTPASQIYVSAYQGIDADVTGTRQSARVVVSRGLWTSASPAELRASVGHLIGHYRHGDQLALAALLGLLTFTTFAGMQVLWGPVARRLGRGRLEGAGDPAALPLLAALFVIFGSAGVVIDHGFIRAINVRADQFSLDHAREPDGLALVLLREWKGERIDPSPLEEAVFYDHPSLESRLLHAMRWKAAHGG